ncbi:MAG: BLUF domain-containing protein [Opitutaceae bacterium]|nr:BLUF domain-containing protein [Opitutaceae bacterium]
MVDSLIYASSATRRFGTADLLELLQTSRRNNERLGVTGMLLFHEGNFLQVLEGPREAVQVLFDKIGRDPRHTNVLVLRHVTQEHRDFPEWSMAFCDLSSEQARTVEGYSSFLNTPFHDPALTGNPALVHKLLLNFKRIVAPHRVV